MALWRERCAAQKYGSVGERGLLHRKKDDILKELHMENHTRCFHMLDAVRRSWDGREGAGRHTGSADSAIDTCSTVAVGTNVYTEQASAKTVILHTKLALGLAQALLLGFCTCCVGRPD